MTEQPTENLDAATPADEPGIESILEEGIRGLETTPGDGSQLEENNTDGKPQDESEVEAQKDDQAAKEEVEELFGELLLEDEKKLSFKTQEEFDQWLEKQPEFLRGGFMRQSDYSKKTEGLSKGSAELTSLCALRALTTPSDNGQPYA